MKYLRYLFLALVGICLILVALANRGMVTIKVLPSEMAAYLGQPLSYELPLFVIIFAAIVIGLLIGFVWEWFREHKHRAEARAQRREKEQLAREVKGLKRKNNEGKDEVLALLDDSAPAR
ncbi:putative integral membrane protein [Litoreibacter ponti]|uniref:Putative integral membrane protein n=1 Tax=Litoreibacter ponti TaxID=1510457 RepID=A0A2T6BDV0_9RHOB|nr:LapA family protein [Litoreibacter ponti]PTX54251.1 putative integral membrane protein [Litoreibacter ponti]